MHKRWPAYQVTAKSSFHYDNLFFLVFSPEDVGLLCQFRLRWLMNQLLICFSCNPVSCTSRALSSSCISWDRAVVYHEQKLVAYVSSEMVFTWCHVQLGMATWNEPATKPSIWMRYPQEVYQLCACGEFLLWYQRAFLCTPTGRKSFVS